MDTDFSAGAFLRNAPRRGQALMELAVGMLALALVVSALVAFALYIVRSLEAQNDNRGKPIPYDGSIFLLGGGEK